MYNIFAIFMTFIGIMENNIKLISRHPAVAGQFYPASPNMLQLEVANIMAQAIPKQCNQVRAIICPHAGYIFSGKIAASAFNQIDSEITYKRVFLITSSHHEYFNSASVYCEGNYIMPYGEEIVDISFCKMLVEHFPDIFTSDYLPHQHEHSVEVQLPFLHYTLKTKYQIVPIIIGTDNPNVCRNISKVLKPYFTDENLFIISTDFSHYPKYPDAQNVDEITKDAIIANEPETLLRTLADNSKKQIPHLSTSLCGWSSVLTLLYITTKNPHIEYRAIDYCNSGDSIQSGDKSRVVGYWGIAIFEKEYLPLYDKAEFQISDDEKKTLIKIARKAIEDYCTGNSKAYLKSSNFSSALETKCGAFVSLHKNGKLRGCIGRMTGDIPLYKMIQEMAISASCHDYRFEPVNASEIKDINIEISVLSPMHKIDSISEIELGKHGVYIEKGNLTGVFLPQVATETGWSKEQFLGHCSRDKADLGWEGWKTADIYIFTAIIFS